MIILKGILMLTFLMIIPTLLGLLITKFLNKEKNNIILAFVLGYLIEFAICQLITVPAVFLEINFTTLVYVYILIVAFLSFVSIVIIRKQLKEIIIENWNEIKTLPKVITILVIICIGIQVYGLVGYMHEDADDAFYVATATTVLETNEVFKHLPQSGEEFSNNPPLRYALGLFPIYHAIMSKIISIHPAIFAHTIIPVIFIPLSYMIYGLIANRFFHGKKEDTLLFLIVLSFISVWGNYSTRATFSLLLFRIWQGKAILANILIPATWLVYLIAKKSDYKVVNYLLITITVLAGTFTTTMGIALIPLSLMLLTIVDELSKIDFKNVKEIDYKEHLKKCIKSFCCCIPALIYLVVYFIK